MGAWILGAGFLCVGLYLWLVQTGYRLRAQQHADQVAAEAAAARLAAAEYLVRIGVADDLADALDQVDSEALSR